MIRHLREIVALRRGRQFDAESGFTLIELLIVIVVIGILAATVIFALSGVTGQSAVAACNSDAKSYEVAVAAYQNSASNTANTAPGATSDLTGSANGGPFLHAAANNPAYIVAIQGDTVTDGTTGVNNGATGTKLATQAGGGAYPAGTVFAGTPGGTLQPYDGGSACNGV